MRLAGLALVLSLAACSGAEDQPVPSAADPGEVARTAPDAEQPDTMREVDRSSELRAPTEVPPVGSGLLPLYRYLHAHPELSNMEVETAAIMADRLRAYGFEVTEGMGGHGVVGVMENGDGPTVMLRADMDGLPVAEETGLFYASTRTVEDQDGEMQPAMHACGHDVHMTSVLGAAQDLADARDSWSGTLLVNFQPAEETVQGAPAMLADGLFTRFPRPDYNLALHVNAGMEAGTIGLVPGYALANVDTVDVTIRGVGGHGAYPHTTRDPVVLASAVIMNLQTIVSRNVDPREAAVITVGSIHGGTKHNIIGEEVALQLTVRSYTDEVREQTLDGIRRVAEHTARAYGLPEDRLPEVVVGEQSAPSTYNDPELTRALTQVFLTEFGPDRVRQVEPVMAAEDFAHYGRTDPPIPSQIFWLGAVDADLVARGGPLPSLHSPDFAPDADIAVPVGARALVVAALDRFNSRD